MADYMRPSHITEDVVAFSLTMIGTFVCSRNLRRLRGIPNHAFAADNCLALLIWKAERTGEQRSVNTLFR